MKNEDDLPHDARKLLAKNMREKRRALDISQEDLADLASLHRTYIGAIERAQQNVSIDNVERIAIALNCPIKKLFERGDDETSS